MDAFYASIEQRDRPELRGRPIAVGYDGPRGVVATASYEARPFGVRSAISSVLARRLCPDLIFVPARFDVYKAVSQQIRDIFHDYTELVEPLSLDEAFLDVSHLRSATLAAREIKDRIRSETGLTASAGISVNKMLAKIASDYRKPDGLFVIPPDKIDTFVAELPVERFFAPAPTCGSGRSWNWSSISARPDAVITVTPAESTRVRWFRTAFANPSVPKRPSGPTPPTARCCSASWNRFARRCGSGFRATGSGGGPWC